MSTRRTAARITAIAIIAVGLAGFWTLATLLITLDCTVNGDCSQESMISAAIGAVCLAVFGYAVWRIWRD
jgi:hypothetical protein